MKKIVVTGIGAISPAGNSPEEMWENCLKGKSSVVPSSEVEDIPPEMWKKSPVKAVAPIKGFDPMVHIASRKIVKRLSNHQRYGVSSSNQALVSSGLLDYSSLDKSRVSVVTAGGLNGADVFCKTNSDWNEDYTKVRGTEFLQIIPNTTSFWVSHIHGFTGPNWHHVSACASGAQAILSGINTLLLGDADVAVCSGIESQPHPMPTVIYAGLRALSPLCSEELSLKEYQSISRPFDSERTGFVLGGGSGTLILETEEHALARGAKIYAEVAGWATNNDSYNLVSPDPSASGIKSCMQLAMNKAAISPSDISYINAHGTSTAAGDTAEAKGITDLFREKSNLIVGSTKSTMGHCQGAAGTLESIISIFSLQNQVAPPTINFENLDPSCAGLNVSSTQEDFSGEYVMSNSFGFGGMNCSLIFKKRKNS